MEAHKTAILLTSAIDLLNRRRKQLKFLAFSCGSAYKDDARQELAKVEAAIEAIHQRMPLAGA